MLLGANLVASPLLIYNTVRLQKGPNGMASVCSTS